MQLDIFGATESSSVNLAAPPIINSDGIKQPEAIILEEALKDGNLALAVEVLNRLKTEAAMKVLLSAGFSVRSTRNRADLMLDVQKDLVEAARLKISGHELHTHRSNAQIIQTETDSIVIDKKGRDHDRGTLQEKNISSIDAITNREHGLDSSIDSESLDAGLAKTGRSVIGESSLHGSAGNTGGTGENDLIGRAESAPSDTPGNSTVVRNSGVTTDVEVLQPTQKQVKFLLDTLSRGIPVFSDMIKKASADQRIAMHSTLLQMISSAGDASIWYGDKPQNIEEFNVQAAAALQVFNHFKKEILSEQSADTESILIAASDIKIAELPQDEAKPIEATSVSEYRYAMVNRPFGIGTAPKEGFIRLEDRPATGDDHHDYARHGVAIYNRKLSDAETKSFELAIMADKDSQIDIAGLIVESLHKYGEAYVDMANNEREQFIGTIYDRIKSTAQGYPASVGNIDSFADLVSDMLMSKVSMLSETSLDDTVATPDDYVISEDGQIRASLGEKFKINIRSIQIVKDLEINKRHATDAERDVLSRYVGWGGLKGVFDPNNKQWKNQFSELKSLLNDAEYAAARKSQLDAHYTSHTVVNAMYNGVARLGFKEGRVLEPSVGVGAFYGRMPNAMRANSSLHGCELDLLTSKIVASLYPSAKIAQGTGFQDYAVPAGYFDMVIGNPPFGSQSVTDQKGSTYSGWSIHNYFFAKSIEMLRPGGIMPMVVSHSFLDKLDPHVRQWIARRAELVSGVRLPNNAFKESANTEVVTDILFFRRLDNENMLGQSETPDWLNTSDVRLENRDTGEFSLASINDYFINNPQNVLGNPVLANTMYRPNTYTVDSNGELESQLAEWVNTLPEGIYQPLVRTASEMELKAVEVPPGVKEGCFFNQDGKIFSRLPDALGETRAAEWEAPNQRARERMVAMINLRENMRSQMRMERDVTSTDDEIERHRTGLNRRYDDFRSNFGFLNDSVNRRIFLDDTESALIQALEFDYEKAVTPSYAEEHGIDPKPAKAVKADILSRRVLFPPIEVANVETAKDALLHSLNLRGRVDVSFMQDVYGKSEKEIVAELDDVIYRDPIIGIVTSDAYLSGDVKTKLVEAKKAAESDSQYTKNVTALEAIIPVDKLPSEIFASIGGSWIPTHIYADFAKEISGAEVIYTHLPGTGQWLASKQNAGDFVKNNTEYGTDKMGATDILFSTMNSRGLEVKRVEIVDGKERYVTDEQATEAVRQRGDKIKAHWESWLWSDGTRAELLTTIYNDRFNRTVTRKFDGSHLTFPGMSPAITLLGHQKNGVWRGLQDRNMLADQVVGAGKTYELATLAMEMRRLGISKKPMFAVPNHLTLQWRSDFYRLYPGANVLAATPQDFEKENRERLFSKIVTGNWDAVVIGHSSLKKLGIPNEAEAKIYEEQLKEIADGIEELKESRGDRNIIRDMEKIKANLEAKLDKLKEKGGKKDNVVNFEDLGVDALFVDEMHEFKNLFFYTQMNRVSGLGNPTGSGKAFDLFIKILWLQETFGENAPLITATGTPVSNSLAEMYTMQRFMKYNEMKRDGLHMFDTWAKQYGDVQTVYEVAPSGTGYRLSQRFAKFKNLPSLMGSYLSFADVVTLDDLKAQEKALGRSFPVPKIQSGRPYNVVAKRSELQEAFFGVPEIIKNDEGTPLFEINLTKPLSIEETDKGKWVLKTDHSSKTFDSKEEAEEGLVLAATTPLMTIDPESIVGQFENLRELTRRTKGKINALSLTSLANKAGLDYRIIDPAAKDHPDSKINQAITKMLATYKKWDADKGTQLVFCDLSVPLSAKAKMANNEKRVYVRNGQGEITHRKGTLHAPKEYEGFPYFLVAEGKGKGRTYTMFDSVSGSILKEGLENKQAGHEFVAQFLNREGGQERWLDLREKFSPIDIDAIEDYKNTHSLNEEGDSADFEISLQDIEGATGVTAFSVYDDIKAKLLDAGIPENQIAFIHDFDTPQAKDALFKRVNAGDVRFLLGSTPKMGAGTNVQKRLVALHHIDAPWRPSDLEQREGRIIRRGNMLYERDPDGFEVEITRYATAQTYDTRRWQLLQHKAAGVEQLRKYSGENEIEDVASEASNSADMKAAASGNPLILKETQLATDVKKLNALARAHVDGQYMIRSRYNRFMDYVKSDGPEEKSELESLIQKRDNAQVLCMYEGKKYSSQEDIQIATKKLSVALNEIDAIKTLIYKGCEFKFKNEEFFGYKMKAATDFGWRSMPSFSTTGVITRMENIVSDFDKDLSLVEEKIIKSALEANNVVGLIGQPFDRADELSSAIAEHGKVQRALMKANSVAAVKPEEREVFDAALLQQKTALKKLGYGEALALLEFDDVELASNDCDPSTIGIVDQGVFHGNVHHIGDGVMTQHLGRGSYVKHAVNKLSATPSIGDTVTVQYENGIGNVNSSIREMTR